MFLITSRFKFLYIKNFFAPGMIYEKWCKSLEKLVFPYEWLTSYDKLSHVGSVAHEHLYSSLSGKNTLSLDEYEEFCAEFHKQGCVTMMDWLREYNLADVVPFIEAVDKTRKQYYDDEIDILKDAVSIPGVSMRYVLNKSLRLNPKIELYAPGEPCKHKCKDSCFKKTCKACKEVQNSCTECTKNEAYELLQTGMVGGPAIVFCRHHERDVKEIREGKQKVSVNRAYQCGIAVYQLAKLRMLEFYYDFLDKYVDRRDFEYCYMDTDSAYFAISGEELRDVVRPEMLDEYNKDVANWLVTDEFQREREGCLRSNF